MNITKHIFSYVPQKRAVMAGLFSVFGVAAIGFGIGMATGVVDVPFAHACCVITPPPPPTPAPPPTTVTTTASPVPACHISANPSSLAKAGDSSTLSWTTTNATSASLNGAGVSTNSGSQTVTPSQTTQYKLSVSGPGGQATCSVQVSVPPPLHVSCQASSASVAQGGSVTYTASVSGGTGNYGFGWAGTGGLTGSSQSTSKIYTAPGSQSATVTVTSGSQSQSANCGTHVTPPPAPTCSLSAAPSSITKGDSSKLSWSTSNANSFSIDNGVGSVSASGGSHDVSPSQTTTYTGTATGPGGTVHCHTTVTVTTPPPPKAPTCSLSISPSTITSGDSAKLSWQTSNASSFTIDNGVGSVASVAVGARPVFPKTTTTYTGTATGPGGTVHCHTTVTVNPPPPKAPSCTLTAVPSSITKGGSAKLKWTTSNATSISIDQGIGSVSPVASGYKVVSPTVTTQYTATVKGAGGTAHCGTTVTVTQPPPPSGPSCTLSASPASIAKGDSSTLTWTSSNATSFTIDHNIGGVTPVANGSQKVSPTTTTTYTATATGSGDTVHCSVTVTVTTSPPPPTPPTCTLSATPSSITKGNSAALKWTSTNATALSIDQGIGSVSPVSGGTQSVSPATTTQYTATATGPGGSATCHTTVTVTTPPPSAPSCTLSASPSTVNSGDHTTLTWHTVNANTFSIDQGIGAVSPAVSGTTTSKAITSDTVFTGTVVGPQGKEAHCTASVTVNTGGGGGGGPTCSLTLSPTSYTKGGSATLSWSGTDISFVDINNGVASDTPSPGSAKVSPANPGTYTYVGTFHAGTGQTLTCKATLTVTGGSGGGGGGCSGSSCGGGGGGGGSTPPTITVSALPHATTQPLTYLYLSQIPYTGLSLGPVGTVVYWVALSAWVIALAYLALFGMVPFVNRQAHAFTARVAEAVRAREHHFTDTSEDTDEADTDMDTYYEEHDLTPTEPATPAAMEASAGAHYSPYEGFKSFGNEGTPLSIDDIVGGLARTSSPRHAHAPTVQHEPVQDAPSHDTVTHNEEPMPTEKNSAASTQQQAPAAQPVAQPRHEAFGHTATQGALRGFVIALLEGDRNAVFGALRQHVRGGSTPESLLSEAVCLVDDIYRSRIDGTPCDPELAQRAANLDTPRLEQLVAALATAIDASYSAGITGAKLALTRALSTLGA